MKIPPPMGEYWTDTNYSVLYQLYRRVETIAELLRRRQKAGHAPLVAHVQELDAIATELKILDTKPPKFARPLGKT